MKDNNNKITYTKAKLIKRISNSLGIRSIIVRKIYEELEESIIELLSTANEDNDVSIRLFEGITIEGEFSPEYEARDPRTGNDVVASCRIRPKVNVTRNYREKVTKLAGLGR